LSGLHFLFNFRFDIRIDLNRLRPLDPLPIHFLSPSLSRFSGIYAALVLGAFDRQITQSISIYFIALDVYGRASHIRRSFSTQFTISFESAVDIPPTTRHVSNAPIHHTLNVFVNLVAKVNND
jgi:hypothetical protein